MMTTLVTKTRDLGSDRRIASRFGWALALGWLLLVGLVGIGVASRIGDSRLSLYILQPFLWLSVGALAFGLRRREAGLFALPRDRWLIAGAALVGLAQVAAGLFAGFLVGFGASPYAREPLYAVLNAWFLLSSLAGQEVARWYLVTSLRSRGPALAAAVSWFALSLVALPHSAFDLPQGSEATIRLIGGVVLPIATQQALATYLSVIGGPLASGAYLAIPTIFEWLSPILPNLKWMLAAFIGILMPVLGLVAVRDLIEWRKAPTTGAKAAETDGMSGWVFAMAVLLFLLWFNLGLFGVRPSLISGHSMHPNVPMGDIAVVQETPANQIKVGDVAQFKRGPDSILHRVIEIRDGKDGTEFVTKGDNNDTADPPISAKALEGKMVGQIPKIGWVPLGLRVLLQQVKQ